MYLRVGKKNTHFCECFFCLIKKAVIFTTAVCGYCLPPANVVSVIQSVAIVINAIGAPLCCVRMYQVIEVVAVKATAGVGKVNIPICVAVAGITPTITVEVFLVRIVVIRAVVDSVIPTIAISISCGLVVFSQASKVSTAKFVLCASRIFFPVFAKTILTNINRAMKTVITIAVSTTFTWQVRGTLETSKNQSNKHHCK